ncbi:MAG: transposase [Candidatus Marinimicrobia bacterium]|nr:transposase [Candidatus Neomarinimicrobiota bacterium]
MLNQKFRWGKGYGVFSVSESGVDKVVRYIKNQEKHHRRKSFREEVKEFLIAYNIEYSDEWLLD